MHFGFGRQKYLLNDYNTYAIGKWVYRNGKIF